LPRHIGHEERSVKLLQDVSKRLRVPNDCKELAQIVAKFHGKLHQVKDMRASTILQFFIDTDAIRQPQRFRDFLSACECDIRGRTGYANCAFPEANLLVNLLNAVGEVDAGAVAKLHAEPEKIKQAVYEARLAEIRTALTKLAPS
jgi:tRNA nucleotidyltransferase (CCA-adding enzyme)